MICTKTKPIWQITSDYTIHWIFWTCSTYTRTVPLSDYYIGSNTLDNMCNAIMCIDGRVLDVRLLSYLPLLPTTKEMIFSALFRFFLMVKSASNRCQSSQKRMQFLSRETKFKNSKNCQKYKTWPCDDKPLQEWEWNNLITSCKRDINSHLLDDHTSMTKYSSQTKYNIFKETSV